MHQVDDQAAIPRISVVMSFRDPGPGLSAALSSLLWQDERDWELIVIDDGSCDGSADIPLLQGDPRIRLVRHVDNAGLAVRLNEAIRLARGGYVARMDAVFQPRRITWTSTRRSIYWLRRC